MIYRHYHAARAEKLAADLAKRERELAEIRGEHTTPVKAQQPAAPQPQAAPQQQQRNEQKRR